MRSVTKRGVCGLLTIVACAVGIGGCVADRARDGEAASVDQVTHDTPVTASASVILDSPVAEAPSVTDAAVVPTVATETIDAPLSAVVRVTRQVMERLGYESHDDRAGSLLVAHLTFSGPTVADESGEIGLLVRRAGAGKTELTWTNLDGQEAYVNGLIRRFVKDGLPELGASRDLTLMVRFRDEVNFDKAYESALEAAGLRVIPGGGEFVFAGTVGVDEELNVVAIGPNYGQDCLVDDDPTPRPMVLAVRSSLPAEREEAVIAQLKRALQRAEAAEEERLAESRRDAARIAAEEAARERAWPTDAAAGRGAVVDLTIPTTSPTTVPAAMTPTTTPSE